MAWRALGLGWAGAGARLDLAVPQLEGGGERKEGVFPEGIDEFMNY